ncbi:toll-like receptor 8 [Coregonus clupeaformis]|uniref:toll-like receptor 8 n=1 Tax=Coregonus clupeaformis TaxID=59861 RepID=UPI001BE0EFBA|nr:toll-like receptor 8 [Coregonus clupeaformis]
MTRPYLFDRLSKSHKESTVNNMAATTCWLQLASLFLCHFLAVNTSCTWMPRQFPCDIKVVNTTNTTDDIIFNCEDRRLIKVPVGITRNVTVLDLSENNIQNVSLDAFSNLENMTILNLNWVNKNQKSHIAEGAFKNLTNLQVLKLNGNGLIEIPQNLPLRLEILVLDNNKINFLNMSNLSGITHVKKLFLSKNCFYWNPCENNFTIGNGTFSALIHLEVLALAYNNLTQVPKELPSSLKTLLLESNKIQYIAKDDFHGLTHLEILELQGNCPRCSNAPYPCVPCPNVFLDIHSHAFHGLTELQTLHLAGNSLRFIKNSWFESLNNLKQLFLSYNFLSKAMTEGDFFCYLPKLEVMDFSFNYDLLVYPDTLLLSRQFSKLVSLRTLHIAGYVFKEIQSDTLSPLHHLKNLSALNMGINFIVRSNSTIFSKFSHLKLIYLGENRLYPVSVSDSPGRVLGSNSKPTLHKSPLTGHYSHSKDFSFELKHGLVKQECFDSGRVLVLSSNNIFFISPKQFEGYGDIACLNLSRNGFSAALNGTEFTSLPTLKYLDLSFNKIDLAYNNAFKELHKLQVLDLSYNSHYFEVSGVTHNLNFLTNLPALKVLNMSHNNIFTLTTKQMTSASLKELQFQHNWLAILWKERDNSYNSLFKNLMNLTYLDISFNSIEKIPSTVYENLPYTLQKLCISHNLLTHFNWDKLASFQQLNTLDLSYNYLYHVSANLSKFTNALQMLDLSHNQIAQLSDGFLKGVQNLQILDLSHNQLTIINETTFLSGPENYVKTLSLQGNPFQCTCDLLEFILWIEENKDVEIPRLATELICNMPAKTRGQPVIRFDIKECVNDNIAFLIYSLSTSLIMLTMVMTMAAHMFYWDASYILYYLRAKLKGYHSLRSATTDNLYDAFVTYDTRDLLVSDWVLNHLRMQLEDSGERQAPLCLEERDWAPGVPLIDNLSQSIRQSRKTVFVLTEAYVRTGTFRMAVYLAHQRLLDENMDVIVLVLLEPVLQHSHFLRLRQRLCGKSVLEWPRTAAAEPWFWQSLRNAVRLDNQVMYNQIYSRYFTNK